jgi:hypothetical protein
MSQDKYPAWPRPAQIIEHGPASRLLLALPVLPCPRCALSSSWLSSSDPRSWPRQRHRQRDYLRLSSRGTVTATLPRRARPFRAPRAGPRRRTGQASMGRLPADCCNRLLRELSAIPDSPPTTPQNAPPSAKPGRPTSSTRQTPSPWTGTSGPMTPAFQQRVLHAALGDILSSL